MFTIRVLMATFVAAAMAGFGTTVDAQQRLSDAAKGLSLQHPEGEKIIVLEGEGGEAQEEQETSADELVFMAQRVFDMGQVAESVLFETRGQDLFFDPGWRQRMLGAVSNVELALRELAFAQIPVRYREGVNGVLDGGRRYQLAGGILEGSIAEDQPVFSAAYDQFSIGHREVTAGLVKLRIQRDAEESEQPVPPPDPYAAKQAIEAVCGRQYGEGERAGYDYCVERQNAALAALNHRFGFNSGVDEPMFNSIRSRCRREWPDDMVARDRCEQIGIERARTN